MTRITAAVTKAKGQPFSLEEVELDSPRAGEVLVRIVATGVCHSDLSVRDQYIPVPLPAVLGHEGAGVVEEVGEGVRKVQPGDHVVLSFNYCAECTSCREGEPAYCLNSAAYNFAGSRPDGSPVMHQNGDVIHGNFLGQSSFGTYALASEQSVVKVRKDVPLEVLAPLGCGIQTGAGTVINALRPRAGSSIVVFGVGSVGLSAIMAAKVVGCTTIIGVDLNEKRLKMARELGATHGINPEVGNLVEEIQGITGGGADYSIEATGLPRVLRQAVECLVPRGICGLVGFSPTGTEASLEMNSILFGRTVRGIIEGDVVPDVFIPRLIELYMQGSFPFDRLIEHYALDDINQAAEDSESGDTLKPVLRMGQA